MRNVADPKIVIVTREPRVRKLDKRYATRGQAKFAVVRAKQIELQRSPSRLKAAGLSAKASDREVEALAELEFKDLADEAETYDASLRRLRGDLDVGVKVQSIDRDFLPNFVFGPGDIVVTVGQDGLVANTAKYAVGLPIVAVNPDPARIDGVLLPFRTDGARAAVQAVLKGRARFREVTLAEAALTDGQRLLAFNDFFVGNRTHVSARYRIELAGRSEPHSSSGVLVSTGAGSTGWLSSVFNMAAGIAAAFGGGGMASSPGGPARPVSPVRLPWEDPRLVYAVREPFVSRTSAATIVAGILEPGQELVVESMMAENGVIFSDGVEADFLEFNSGATARIAAAAGKARLVVP